MSSNRVHICQVIVKDYECCEGTHVSEHATNTVHFKYWQNNWVPGRKSFPSIEATQEYVVNVTLKNKVARL